MFRQKNSINKYANKKTIFAGHKFDSKKEASRYQELLLLERSGQIKDLVLQPKFLLQDSFTDLKGKKHLPINYIADFRYIENNITVIEDVKPSKDFQTTVYKLKKKLFLYRFPFIDFREVY